MTYKELLDYVPTIAEQEIYRQLVKHYHLCDIETELSAVYNKDIHDLEEYEVQAILEQYEDNLDYNGDWSFSCDSAIRQVLGYEVEVDEDTGDDDEITFLY